MSFDTTTKSLTLASPCRVFATSRRLAAACLGLVLIAGCGPSRPETVRVSGVVTVDGATPPGPGTLHFHPVEAAEGFPARPGKGEFDTSGRFTATTYEAGDGLMPGRYQISVECWEHPPSMGGPRASSYILGKYRNSQMSGLEELVIEPRSRAVEVSYDLVGRGGGQ